MTEWKTAVREIDPDYESMPAIAITQWRAGRVLSEDDVTLIGRLLKEHDDDMNREVDLYAAAREQVLRELGGQAMVDLAEKSDELTDKLAWERAKIRVAEKQAELDRLSQ